MIRKVLVFKPFLFIFLLFTVINNFEAESGNVNFPSFFMKNKGQFSNGSQYCLKSAKSNTFFFENYIVNQFITSKKENDSINPNILNMRIDFENSNPHPLFEEKNPLASKSNFFTGNDASSWKTDIASFATLSYKNLYDKVDLVYYNSAKGIKSDFVVHAGGNYKDIILKYSGIKDIAINSQGVLKIITDAGELTEHIPEAYQMINGSKIIVNVNFRIKNGNTVVFDAEDFNPDYDLVIDPQLIFCSYFGGNNDDQIFHGDIVKDSQGNIYFTCKSQSLNFPVSTGSYSNINNGSYDVVVIKLNPDATQILFSTYIGGNGDDCPYSIKLSGPLNDIVVAGFTQGPNFPVTPGTYQSNFTGGGNDGFLLKLNNSGSSLKFSTYIGSNGADYIQDVVIDASLNILICGYSSSVFPTTPGAYQSINSGGYDIFVSKLNSTGTILLASTMIGGYSNDRGLDVAFDNTGNIFISGSVEGPFPTTTGAFDETFNGGAKDVVVCKFNPGLTSLLYSTYLGGNEDDSPANGFTIDNLNQVTITGLCGRNFPTTSGAYCRVFAGGTYDMFLTRLNSTFSGLVFSTLIGGSGNDFGYSFSLNKNGDIIVTGPASLGFPTTPCAYDITYNGNGDAFIAKFNSNGSNLLYSSYFGGANYELGTGVWMDGDTATIIGDTQSSDLPVTSDAFDKTFNGGLNDVFLAKIVLNSGNTPVVKFNNSIPACVLSPINFLNSTTNGTTYSWNFGDGNISNTINPIHSYSQPGNYSVSLIALNACGSDTVISSIKINGYLSTHPISICYGDSLLVNGVYHHIPGNYNEIYLTSLGCDSIVTTNLSVIPLNQTIQTPSICYGGTFTVGSHIYSNAGIYTDILNSFSGCDSIVTTNLTIKPIIQTTQNSSICQGETFSVGIHYYTASGTYRDTLKTGAGCDSVVISNLTVNPIPNPSLGNDTLMCPGELIVLTPGIGFSKYAWSDGSDLNVLHVTQPGTYSVNVFEGLCSASDTISIDGCGIELWFPNVFTPNHDALNETFRPVAQGIITSYQITIFNRWGQKLYESNDAIIGWDGTFEGRQCPDGAYFYIAEYNVDTARQRTTRGSITLLR